MLRTRSINNFEDGGENIHFFPINIIIIYKYNV